MCEPDANGAEDKRRHIENLFIGPEAKEFHELERRLNQFCPFEAIGMVQQEIRHGRFLQFLLDPNERHPFGEAFLKTLLQSALEQATSDQAEIRPIDVHFSDYENALIYRERNNIDLQIEAPATAPGGKGLVVAIELKIYAAESETQLENYRDTIIKNYPSDDWHHLFVFLTLDATPPSDPNRAHWIPVSLLDVLNVFETVIQAKQWSGEATDFTQKYISMVRRRLVEDEKLVALAHKIWAKHRTALKTLMEYQPRLSADAVAWLADKVDTDPEILTREVADDRTLTLAKDTSTTKFLRFYVQNWTETPNFCDAGNAKWLASNSLIIIELENFANGRVQARYVMGGHRASLRQALHTKLVSHSSKKVQAPRAGDVPNGGYQHYNRKWLLTTNDVEKAEAAGTSAEELGKKLLRKFNQFLNNTLPVFDECVQNTFAENPRPDENATP